MIDTIKISRLYPKMPGLEELERRGWRPRYNEKTGERSSWSYKEDGQYPYLSLFVAPDWKVYLSARVSLPTFLFGSNVRLPDQSEVMQGLGYAFHICDGKKRT